MVSGEEVININKLLATNGIQVWLTGGWGIDALLGDQTRSHKDLDVFIQRDDISRMCEILGKEGYSLKELWSENLWVLDAKGIKIATAFVLQDPLGRELDVHAMHMDEYGNGIPEWEKAEGFILTEPDLSGVGVIAGFSVQCITAEKQTLCHTGYELPDYQLRDLKLLHEKFGV